MTAAATIVLLLLTAIVSHAATSSHRTVQGDEPVSVDLSTRRLVDAFGREVYFHGANVVFKTWPYLPSRGAWDWNTSFVAKDMELMQRLGMNGIRLGTMWPGVEPVRGWYNHTYLAMLTDIIKEAQTYNIHSLLDMHQDVMSEKFCGEGVPLWAAQPNSTNFPSPIAKVPYKVNDKGIPSHADCMSHSWAEYYFTVETGQAFQNLYTNVDGLRDKWAAFWRHVASHVKSLGTAIIGYELINEPWAGDVVQDPELIVPGVADKKLLQPFYEVGAGAIRETDSAHCIFFEPTTWDDFGTGFTQVPGGDAWKNKSVLSYHLYFPPDLGTPDFEMSVRAKDMQRLGCGGFLTEFATGACNGCGNVDGTTVMDACDAYAQSWLYWAYKKFGGITGDTSSLWHSNGTLNEALAFNLSRTYAQVVAGRTISSFFDLASGDYALQFEVRANVTNPISNIYASREYHYPNGGYNVTVQTTQGPASGVYWIQATSTIIQVVYDPALVPPGAIITVAITSAV